MCKSPGHCLEQKRRGKKRGSLCSTANIFVGSEAWGGSSFANPRFAGTFQMHGLDRKCPGTVYTTLDLAVFIKFGHVCQVLGPVYTPTPSPGAMPVNGSPLREFLSPIGRNYKQGAVSLFNARRAIFGPAMLSMGCSLSSGRSKKKGKGPTGVWHAHLMGMAWGWRS